MINLKSVGIIYYPLHSVWNTFRIIKALPYFFSKKIWLKIDLQNTDIIDIDYIIIQPEPII